MRSRVVAAPLAVVALAGAGVAAYGAVGVDSIRYRTVEAGLADLEQTLDLTGVVEASGRTDLSFGAGGTVGDVRVSQGDEVEEGDVIAVLDRSTLRSAVDRATADLAAAKAQLVEDRAAQSSVVEAASAAPTTGSSGRSTPSDAVPGREDEGASGGSSGGSDNGAATAAVLAKLATQQDAVITAQTAATTALGAATTALATQQDACAAPVVDAGEGAAGDGGEGETDTGTGEAAAVISEECTTALSAVQAAQTTAADAQTSLQTALEALGDTLAEALSTLSPLSSGSNGSAAGSTGSAGSPSSDSDGNGSDAAVSVPSGSASQTTGDTGASGMTRTVTAATLAADQAAIDSAKAALLAAKAELAGAVVRAPAGGTVASLSVAQDAQVAAGDPVAILVAPGLTTVSVDVTMDQATQLEVGMAVEATPAGSEEALTGSVSRIDHVTTTDATSSGSDPTYGVEMVLDERDLALPDGMPASVTVVVGSAEEAVTVPASAVSDGVVTVLEGDEVRQVRVSTGIVGSTRIEITDGIEEGDLVVLADLGAEVATGDSEQTGPGGGLGGGGITGGFGGGFSGGPPSGGMVPR
ncbi:biotin/lipoyl-binding protein [Nocardioides caeni]|uniref:Biotin/lipoyl-binding protein n=1 Tax=Nocardioides caeni TaxID=574700 RepID=A0A4V4HJ16_9ACTN|nr:biotin/lipoyl-binding protein [Nocardioides caeni]